MTYYTPIGSLKTPYWDSKNRENFTNFITSHTYTNEER